MRKKSRVLSAILAGIMACTLMCGTVNMEVKASDEEQVCIDGSYLTDESSSEGITDFLTWGTYLKSGSSAIAESGSGKIAAGGNTVGQRIVSKIQVYVRVQKLVNGKWQAYSSWSASETDSAYVSTTKTFTVPKGYYYRVYCTHVAGSDTSSSSTNGIYID